VVARGFAVSIPAWQQAIIAAGELYRVGGAVRDALMGLPDTGETDYLVRGIEPAAFEEILRAHGRFAFAGKVFGVYKFTPAGGPVVDIAFPRTETSTGTGHRDFVVRSDGSLPVAADLRRRDFTINAIAERVPDGARVDPFGGAEDIAHHRLRMIFPEAFEEDPLRILRGARFAARFGLEIEPETRARMQDAAGLLATVSAERLQDEFGKTLAQCDRPSHAFNILHEIGGLAVVLPELERAFGVAQNEYHPDDVYWHSLKTCDAAPAANPAVRWAALLHDLGKVDTKQVLREGGAERVVFYGHEVAGAGIAERVLERLRCPRALVTRCRHLVREHMFRYESEWREATLRRFMRRIGEDCLDDLFALREADCRSRDLDEEIAKLDELRARVADELRATATLRVTGLAVDGEDVMRVLGVPAGPGVGRVLERLLEAVLEHPELNDRQRLLEMLAKERKGK
jgi:putative nucleotidyltransferase with HDIG domain